LEIFSNAEDELAATAEAITRVEATADLRLDVKDPAGPISVGDEATYELVVRNRGTKNAQEVEVKVFFSEGIEPTVAEGGANRLLPGQVVFNMIPSLAPGADVTLRVRAKASEPGNHVFRAEVHCKPLGARLVREETTRFYQDGQSAKPTSGVPAVKENAVAEAPLRPTPGPEPVSRLTPSSPAKLQKADASVPLFQSVTPPTDRVAQPLAAPPAQGIWK
jgi:hypothetical protein